MARVPRYGGTPRQAAFRTPPSAAKVPSGILAAIRTGPPAPRPPRPAAAPKRVGQLPDLRTDGLPVAADVGNAAGVSQHDVDVASWVRAHYAPTYRGAQFRRIMAAGWNPPGVAPAPPPDPYAGLLPADAAYLKGFDTQTQAQVPVIQGAYADYANAARTAADAASTRLGNLAALAGTTQSPGGTPASDLAAARQQQALATAAQAVNTAGTFVPQAQGAGLAALNAYQAQRAQAKQDYLAAAQKNAAQAAKDAAAQALQQAQIAETARHNKVSEASGVRGQNLDYLTAQMVLGGQNARALLNAETSTANTNARTAQQERASIRSYNAKIRSARNQLRIAVLHDQTTTANNIRNNIRSWEAAKLQAQTRLRTALAKGKGAPKVGPGSTNYATTRRQFASQAPTLLSGTPRSVAGKPGQYQYVGARSPIDVFNQGVASGLRPVDVYRTIVGLVDPATNQPYVLDPIDLYNALENLSGPKKARALVKRLTGHDPVALATPFSPSPTFASPYTGPGLTIPGPRVTFP